MTRQTLSTISVKIDYLTQLLEKLDHSVHGNGKEGLNTRVDRIEQIETGRKWTIRALVSTMLALISGFILKLMVG